MRIAFGLHLDGLNPTAPRNAVGEATLGPAGLLQVLETQLGLPSPDVHASEASFSYLQCLQEASTPERFFHRSLEVDPVNVARTLLGWRAQWYEAGWDGTFPSDAPARLADMAAVEAIARGRVPPTVGERLQRVAAALAERRTQIEELELHTPFDDLPQVWRRVIRTLPWTPAPGLELAVAGPNGSDLARVQRRLLAMVDRGGDGVGSERSEPLVDRDREGAGRREPMTGRDDASAAVGRRGPIPYRDAGAARRDEMADHCDAGAAQRELLRNDGSLVLIKAASTDLSADAIAEFLLATGGIGRTLLVAETDGIVLDNALERAGLPRCGFQHHTRFRSATQVLKLALALLWQPVDPHRMLQFLLHPSGPLPGWVRWRLADAVAASPGIGGPQWVEAIDGIARKLRESYAADATGSAQGKATTATGMDRAQAEANPGSRRSQSRHEPNREASPLRDSREAGGPGDRREAGGPGDRREAGGPGGSREAGGPGGSRDARESGGIRDTHEVAEREVARLRADISFWLETERFDPEGGAPLDTLIERAGRVSAWASTQANTAESRSVANMFGAARAQAEALVTELAELRQSGVRRIAQLELQRRIDEVTTEAPDPSTFAEAGHAPATSAAAAVTDSWPAVVWWNLARDTVPISYPWSRSELDALRASGVHLPENDAIVRQRSREWLRPLCNASEQLVLIAHHDDRGAHPLWTRIDSLFEGLREVEIEPLLFAGGTIPASLAMRTRVLPLKRLRAPRRWWSLPADCAVAPREAESWSSLSKLCDYPHEWVLRYAARLRAGRATAVSDGPLLWGSLGHRLFEEFFRTREDWPDLSDAVVLAWVRSELPGLVEREGAVLLGHGRGVERERVTATLERALVQLLAHLRSAGVVEAAAEVAREAPFDGRRLIGAIDLLLRRGDGQRAVLDVKWSSERYRGELLKHNRAIQLAIYAYLQKCLDGRDAWPAGAFFILATGNVLAAGQATFPSAVAYPADDGSGTAELWERFRVTCDWRWRQLEQGRIEVVTGSTEADERSEPPNGGLAPVSKGDPYDDFLRLTGWDISR